MDIRDVLAMPTAMSKREKVFNELFLTALALAVLMTAFRAGYVMGLGDR